MKLDRRAFVAGLTATTGGVMYSSGLSAMLADAINGDNAIEDTPRSAFIDQPVDAFSPEKRRLVSTMCETLIPRTDTPGAIDAQVPKFVELLYDQWMAKPERALFDGGLKVLNQRAQTGHGAVFTDCDAAVQKSLLEALEDEQADHPWFSLGGETVVKNRDDVPFMALFKEIAVTGFFMSEVGATQVLRFNPMPGSFDGELSLTSGESSWAASPFM